MSFAPITDFPELRLGPQVSASDPRRAEGHHPYKPTWQCRTCGDPWPCGTARLLLNAAYRGKEPELSIYMCGMLYQAVRDLYRLNRYDRTKPYTLFVRFLAWTHHSRTLVPPPELRAHVAIEEGKAGG